MKNNYFSTPHLNSCQVRIKLPETTSSNFNPVENLKTKSYFESSNYQLKFKLISLNHIFLFFFILNIFTVVILFYLFEDLQSNTQITQTSTLTTTTTSNKANVDSDLCANSESMFNLGTNLICNPVRLSAFIDLDRLVLELSSLNTSQPEPANNSATTFTNEQCNYLVSQFETFAKEFKRKEMFESNTPASTPSKSADLSFSTVTSSLSGTTPKKKTVYSNTLFKHEFDQKLTSVEGIIKSNHLSIDKSIADLDNNQKVLSKLVDHKTTTKTNFMETNIFLNDQSVDEILQNAKVGVVFFSEQFRFVIIL